MNYLAPYIEAGTQTKYVALGVETFYGCLCSYAS